MIEPRRVNIREPKLREAESQTLFQKLSQHFC